jgi:hypothetical protein
MHNKRNAGIAVAALLAALQGHALADATTASVESSPDVQAASPLNAQPILDDQALDTQRGGTAVVNDMKLDGLVSDNQAYNLSTGGNSISDGSFAGSSGLPTVIQNSGNNVLIQNATIVNVQVQ